MCPACPTFSKITFTQKFPLEPIRGLAVGESGVRPLPAHDIRQTPSSETFLKAHHAKGMADSPANTAGIQHERVTTVTRDRSDRLSVPNRRGETDTLTVLTVKERCHSRRRTDSVVKSVLKTPVRLISRGDSQVRLNLSRTDSLSSLTHIVVVGPAGHHVKVKMRHAPGHPGHLRHSSDSGHSGPSALTGAH
jgi:hypothetical protein